MHTRISRRVSRTALLAALLVPMLPRPLELAAQEDTARIVIDTSRSAAGWDSPRVVEMMKRATVRRTQPQADTALRNYRATAEGFVYFFLDRRANDERTLVRVNQIGLELFWQQPGTARQRIMGMRDASPLPNTMRYHLDHLTMVQNGFGDVIRMGDGDEVRDVMHPASAAAPTIYEYRLADSLDLRLPSMQESLRVYEVQVRPRRTDRPGFVGSVFIDRATADVIRMTFTFTPSSYVDKRLDYINLSLDNGLWDGKYWLPNEQTVEIRRQLPELDFAAGSVIRGRMRILDYELNATIPDSIFRTSRAVVAAPPAALESYAFQSGIFDDLKAAGLEQPPELEQLRLEAAQMIGRRLMSGLPALRLYYRDASSAIRYNRAEGLFLGTGLTYSIGPPWRFDATAGYAFGSERGSGLARIAYSPKSSTIALTGYSHALRDLGPVTPMAGVANSVSALLLGRDYLDAWYATGGALSFEKPVGRGYRLGLSAAAEQHQGPRLGASHPPFADNTAFRAVREISEGDELSFTAGMSRQMPTSGRLAWGGSLSARAAHAVPRDGKDNGGLEENKSYVRPMIELSASLRESPGLVVRGSLAAATISDGAPLQHQFMIGGIGTLPGYAYRSFVGQTGAIVTADATQRLWYPWVGVRALGAVGAVSNTGTFFPDSWGTVVSGSGARASAGAGLSLFWDLLQVDAVKGLNGGKWVVQMSFTRALDDIG